MPIAIACVDCGFAARVKDHLGGKVVECPGCRAGIQVPAAGTAAPPSAPKPPKPAAIRAESPHQPRPAAASTPAPASASAAAPTARPTPPPAPATPSASAPKAAAPPPAANRPPASVFDLDDDAEVALVVDDDDDDDDDDAEVALVVDDDDDEPVLAEVADDPWHSGRRGSKPDPAPTALVVDDDEDGGEYAVVGELAPAYAPARASGGRDAGPVKPAGLGRTPIAEAAEQARLETRPTRTPRQILAAFRGEIEPVRPTPLYRIALVVVAAAMLVLPLAYLLLVGAVAAALGYHATHSHVVFLRIGASPNGAKGAIVLYFGPIVAGGALVLFLLKPLFARPAKAGKTRVLNPEAQPLLFAFVDGVCQAVGARTPSRIVVDCEVNASASFVRGPLAVWDNRLTLTIGLPLAAGLDLRQFAGVLAHEFGHFSQGAGMRVSNLIRSLNGWFARLVFERDRWDDGLDRLARAGGGLVVVGLLAKLAIWLVRRVLRVLMMTGHAISCFLMRQMEYDADRYEARMVGPDAFEATMRRIGLLQVAAHGARADLADCWRENRLADDLPRLVLANLAQIPAEAREALERAGDSRRTGAFDTHPSDADRIANARLEGTDGVFRLEGPATDLFRDFDALCRAATLHHYRRVLGQDVRPEALTAVADVVSGQEAVAEGHRGLERFYLGAFDPSRTLPLPAVPPSAPSDPKRAVGELNRARGALVAARARYKEALGHRRETLGRLVEVQAASDLLRAGFKGFKAADFGLRRARPDEADATREELEAYLLRLSPHFEPFEGLVVCRLMAGLSLLESGAIAPVLPEADAWRAEARGLYPVGAHVAGRVLPAVVAVVSARGSLERALGLLRGNEEDRPYIDGVLRSARRLHDRLTELHGRLGNGLRYPFHHGDGAVGLAHYALPALPGRDDVGPLFEAAGEAIDRVLTLHCRLVGRLALAVEEVERSLGLPAMVPPADGPGDGDDAE